MNLYFWTDLTHTFGLFLMGVTIKSTLLLSVILLIDLCCTQRRAAWRNLLWSTGLLGLLLIPLATILLPTVPIPVSPHTSQAPLLKQAVYLTQPTTTIDPSPQSIVVAPLPKSQIAKSPLPAEPVPALPALNKKQWWTNIAITVYLLGLLVLLLRLSAGLAYIANLRRHSRPITNPQFLHCLQTIKARLGLERPIKFAHNDALPGPTQVGFLSPAIIIPSALLKNRNKHELESILAHELAHAHRLDYFFNLVSALAKALHWFNPLVWLASNRQHQSSEQACDDWTIDLVSNPDAYAQTLLGITVDLRRSQIESLGANMAGTTSIKRRIDRIITLDGQVAPRIGRLLGSVIVIAVLASALTLGSSVLHAEDTPDGEGLEWNEQTDWSALSWEDRWEAAEEISFQASRARRANPNRAIQLYRLMLRAHPHFYSGYQSKWSLLARHFPEEDLVAELENDLAAIEQYELNANQFSTRLLGYQRLFIHTGEQAQLAAQQEMMARLERAYPDSAVKSYILAGDHTFDGNWQWSLELLDRAERLSPDAYWFKWHVIHNMVRQDSVLDARLIQKIEDDIPKIDRFETGKYRFSRKKDAYSTLYAMTRDPVYLWRTQEILKEFLAAYPDSLAIQRDCLFNLGRFASNPKEAAQYFRRYAELNTWQERLSMEHYQRIMRLESFYPGTLTNTELTDFFQAWAADIDSFKTALASHPESLKIHLPGSRLIETSAQYYLWQADIELTRNGDAKQAAQWLQQASTIRQQGTEFHYNLYVDARLELRLGDIAWLNGDPKAARQHYQNAEDELASSEKSWSQKNVEEYAGGGLKELNRLGYTIKARLQERGNLYTSTSGEKSQ